MGDVGLAIQRAEDKTAQMQARGRAIDELIASGALDDATQLNAGDDITRELDAEQPAPTSRPSWPGSRLRARRRPSSRSRRRDILGPPSPSQRPAEGESNEGGPA